MKKLFFFITFLTVSFSMNAQIEDRESWDADYDEDPQLFDDDVYLTSRKRDAEETDNGRKAGQGLHNNSFKDDSITIEVDLPQFSADNVNFASSTLEPKPLTSYSLPPLKVYEPLELMELEDEPQEKVEETKSTPPSNYQRQQHVGHIKFMGFELTGTIDEFHKKMLSKGLTPSPLNSSLPVGQRIYSGIFSGHEADIAIFYNARTRIVYRGKAIITCHGKDLTEQLQSDMKLKLNAKYGEEKCVSDTFKDENWHEFSRYAWLLDNGSIGLFITSTSTLDTDKFKLHIDYNDLENEVKNKLEEMDDL